MQKQFNSLTAWQRILDQAETAPGDLLYEIANHLDHGYEINEVEHIEVDHHKAFHFYQKAAQKGHIDATIRLADFYSEGLFCKKDITLALNLYQIGIENNRGHAAFNQALIYRDLEDYSKAFSLYQIAQTLDQAPSIELAYCHYYGLGTPINKEKALIIFETIAKNDPENKNTGYEIDDANYYLGLYYLEGTYIEKSTEKARFYFEKANRDQDHRPANELLLLIQKP